MTNPLIHWRGTSALVALGASLWLGACSPQGTADKGNTLAMSELPALPATLPLAQGPATTSKLAPAVAALPTRSIRTVRVANPRDAYAYAEDAYDFGNVVHGAPPDYTFDDNGVEPLAWQGYDNSRTFAEPVDGGYRYYYYRPGEEEPYFIRDPDYGYGYDDGQLAVVYAHDGAIVPYDDYGPRLDHAGRYLARADALYAASRGHT
ncbi:MAG: hypothetical protein M3R41_07045, partial [Pseudomonadota bacterium]|nr:hypothetical protein [Pseudomonadota bacterium]